MIVDWLVEVGSGAAQWLLLLIPSLPLDALTSGATVLADLATTVSSLGVWVDWFALSAQVALVLGLYFTFLALRILRALLGHIPFIGGNG